MNHDLCAAALWRANINCEALMQENAALRGEIERMKAEKPPEPLRVVREEKEDA